MVFNSKIESILIYSGWSRNRSVNIKKWKDKLKCQGFKGHEFAFKLLCNIGGLKVESIPNSIKTFASITFIPTLEGSLTMREIVEINEESGLNLYPLGLNSDDIAIVISETGKLYGLLSNIVFRYGNTLESSLECLFRINGQITDLEWDYNN